MLDAVLDRHGRTYAAEAGIRLGRRTPSPRYRLLCLATLLSARIRAHPAGSANRALADAGRPNRSRLTAARNR